MKIITRQTKANEAAKRWVAQYGVKEPAQLKGIGKKLLELGDNPNPDEVDKIIGNNSWTAPPDCNECHKTNLSAIIEVGDEPDYDSSTAWLCVNCVEKALHLLNGVCHARAQS